MPGAYRLPQTNVMAPASERHTPSRAQGLWPKAPEAGAGSEPAAPDHLHPMMTTWPAHKAH